MDIIKPAKISSEKLSPNAHFTCTEMGKLWATYIGNTMSLRILQYFLQNVEDEEIKGLVETGIRLSEDFIRKTEGFFNQQSFPIPIGFTEQDVNLKAPRLYQDEFYVHYLKYAAKAGMSLYAVAIPLVMKEDIREFFVYCNQATSTFLGQINNVLMTKGLIIKPPIFPIPEKVDFIKKQHYMNGFMGDIRSLHALEVTHLYDNTENNVTSKALMIGFSQVAQNEKVRDLFRRGIDINERSVRRFHEKLYHQSLPAPTLLDHYVTTSTVSPFSDKLMLFHKVDMFSMKIRSFANSMAVSARRDLSMLYTKCLADVALFVDDAANLMIDNGWMEQPPKAADREDLTGNVL